jgi:hypothetical protein
MWETPPHSILNDRKPASIEPVEVGAYIDSFRENSETRKLGLDNRDNKLVPRRIFAVLVSGLAIFIVAFAVLMAFYALVSALGDSPGALVLLRSAVATLVLLLVDLLLLVGALGLAAVGKHQRDDND